MCYISIVLEHHEHIEERRDRDMDGRDHNHVNVGSVPETGPGILMLGSVVLVIALLSKRLAKA